MSEAGFVSGDGLSLSSHLSLARYMIDVSDRAARVHLDVCRRLRAQAGMKVARRQALHEHRYHRAQGRAWRVEQRRLQEFL